MAARVRKTILVLILMLVAGAFAYERLVVQRQPVQIQAELMDFVNDTSHNYTESEVLELVNRPYETVYDSDKKKIVKYTWQGLSWNKYNLFVVFRRFANKSILSDVSMSEPSPTKPFIDPRDERQGNTAEENPQKPDGDVPQPAQQSRSRGLVEGG